MLFIATGGTIDKCPVFLPDGQFDHDSKVFAETQLPDMLQRARYRGKQVIRTLCMVDSLDMTNDHRRQLVEMIEDNDHTEVVVTHGTDTMAETGRYLVEHLPSMHRTIVLTGAMVPYAVDGSDALFNIGTAVAHANTRDRGVFVSMNGQRFDARNVRKNIARGIFEARG